MQRPSLFSKCQGPNAVPIERLVARGEKAAAAVRQEYGDYLPAALSALAEKGRDFLSAPTDPAKCTGFLEALRDIKSSAATAEREWVLRFAASLDALMQTRAAGDAHLPVIVDLHLDALTVAARRNASAVELKYLEERLASVTSVLR